MQDTIKVFASLSALLLPEAAASFAKQSRKVQNLCSELATEATAPFLGDDNDSMVCHLLMTFNCENCDHYTMLAKGAGSAVNDDTSIMSYQETTKSDPIKV